jgi:hypothetical protein
MVKLIKPLFYEDIDELIGGLLKKKKKKKKITYAASQYSTLKKISPKPAKNPKFRDISPYAPPAVPAYFPLVPAGLKAKARKPDAGRRRTHAEQLADLGRDTELKTLKGLTKFQQGIRRLLEGKPTAERKKIIAEEERRLKEEPITEKLTSVSSKSRRKQIEQARKEGKLRPLPPRAAEEKEGEYEDPPMLFPPVPPKLPSELALLESVKKRGRPPKSPAQKAEAAAVKKEAAAVKKSEIAAAKREEGLKKSKSGSLDAIFGKLAPKVSPKAAKVSPKAETLGELPTGFGKFKNQKRRKY